MPDLCAESFDRELACTEAQWSGWLQDRLSSHPHRLIARAASVQLGNGELSLSWREPASRVGPGSSVPTLVVSFRFRDVEPVKRYLFARQFDVWRQRYVM